MNDILSMLQQGTITIEEAKAQLASYEDLGFAKVDHHRKKRNGFPETIYGEGKTAQQISEIIGVIEAKGDRILVTRLASEKAAELIAAHSNLNYNETAQILHTKQEQLDNQNEPYIAILCAGTSDLRVAEEAAVTAEVLGARVKRFYDVGVAGIHRLFDQIDVIRDATCTLVVAGMDGALPSVVGGLVSHPVIAVPTSVGYGANFGGVAALLTMLNSCASGISVVNIDNGFGGAFNAVLIHNLAKRSLAHES